MVGLTLSFFVFSAVSQNEPAIHKVMKEDIKGGSHGDKRIQVGQANPDGEHGVFLAERSGGFQSVLFASQEIADAVTKYTQGKRNKAYVNELISSHVVLVFQIAGGRGNSQDDSEDPYEECVTANLTDLQGNLWQ